MENFKENPTKIVSKSNIAFNQRQDVKEELRVDHQKISVHTAPTELPYVRKGEVKMVTLYDSFTKQDFHLFKDGTVEINIENFSSDGIHRVGGSIVSLKTLKAVMAELERKEVE